MKVGGTITGIYDAETFGSFQKRMFELENDDGHMFAFELHQDKVSLIDAFSTDDVVLVFFNIRGRSWHDSEGHKKYFNSLVVWKIKKDE